MMKDKIKKFLPCWFLNMVKGIINSFSLLPLYAYWFWKDVWNSTNIRNEKSDLAALLVAGHVLEKGITMPERRLGFGYIRVRSLIQLCSEVIHNYSNNHIELQCALKDLEQYLQIHQHADFNLPDDIVTSINELLEYKTIDTHPCYKITKDEYFKKTTDFYEFAHQRHTVRWYSEKRVDNDTLIKAIKLAQTAPSACNRQSSRVYIIDTKDKKDLVLQLQNGNRGFGHKADKILLITSEMKCWSHKSRSSAYLDSGIFTMNLLYSLHYYNILACTLNASMSIRNREKLMAIVGCSKSEIPVVFVAIGNAPDVFCIPGSHRIDTEKIYKFV